MFSSKDKILIIAAHPDDEVIGCGGTIIKAKTKNCKVSVLFLGEGVSTRYPNLEKSTKALNALKQRELSAKKCLKVLNVDEVEYHRNFCTRFDQYPLIDFVRIIEKKIKNFKPSIIFTHNQSELNIDHQLTFKATEVACRPLKNSSIKKIFSYEAVCSGNFTFEKKFNPNVYVDIKKFFKKKIVAFRNYKNEIKKYPFPRSIKGIEILARYRGLQSGLEFAEAFRLEREIS